MKQENIDLPEAGLIGKMLWQERYLWQMRLQSPGELARFSRDRGVDFSIDRNIIKLWQLRLLRADLVLSSRKLRWKGMIKVGVSKDGRYVYADERIAQRRSKGWTNALESLPDFPPYIQLLFHPFRFYVLLRLEQKFGGIKAYPLQMLAGNNYPSLIEFWVSGFQKNSSTLEFVERITKWNNYADLAILSEPFSFMTIFGMSSLEFEDPNVETSFNMYENALSRAYKHVGLDKIEEIRQRLCADAELFDRNRTIHAILRFSSGEFRRKIKGRLGGAILLKTMAEMLRRSAEDVFKTELREEDEIGLGFFPEGAKEQAFGSKRIFDGNRGIRREYLRQYMLDYGIRLRWYVEGSTEFGALSSIVEAYAMGIQIVNLAGQIVESRRKGLAFRDSLRADLKEGVFSYILLDADRADYVRPVKKAASDDDFCGQFFLSTPDIEKYNFDDDELVQIIWEIAVEEGAVDEQRPSLIEAISDASSGNEIILSAQKSMPQLSHLSKGEEWGRRLGEYAWLNPTFKNGTQRPIVIAIESAMTTTYSDFRSTRQDMKVNPETGEFVKRAEEGGS